MFKKKPLHIETTFLSKLLKNAKEERNPNILKRKLKKILIENYFSSIIAFMEN